jgi:hypothetical protein
MRTVTAYIRRTPDACWRVLVDAALLPHWVPGLRRAVVVARGPDQLPAEIQFEFSTKLTYSLTYSYDVDALELRFEPRLGKRDGVRGFAKLTPFDDGARLEYGLEEGDGRTPADRAIGDLDALVAAFARWMHGDR